MTDDEKSEFHGIPIEKEDPEVLFEILRLLGKGTFGHAYMVRNTNTNEIVAAKQIPLVSDEEIEVVRREVRILSMCDHPNVVRYRGTYRGLNALWITMEYCAGGSVDGIYNILKRPLPENLIAYICREVVQGLVYLHSVKKIHRDIKGGNILLTQDGSVKISDFGVSTELMHSMSRRNSFIGTLYWMAPETIQEKEYDERADIWSLGITLIEIAEGQPPRRDMHYALALFAIPNQPAPQLRRRDDWSPVMHKFLAKLLVKDPQHRPTAEQLLADPFLAPQSIGPDAQAQLRQVIEAVQERAAGMTTARRLGEESSESDATVVERRSDGDSGGEASDADESAADDGDEEGDEEYEEDSDDQDQDDELNEAGDGVDAEHTASAAGAESDSGASVVVVGKKQQRQQPQQATPGSANNSDLETFRVRRNDSQAQLDIAANRAREVPIDLHATGAPEPKLRKVVRRKGNRARNAGRRGPRGGGGAGGAGDGGAGGGGGDARRALLPADHEASLIQRCVEEGLLVPLPPISTDEIDLDELCPGTSLVAPLTLPTSDADIIAVLQGGYYGGALGSSVGSGMGSGSAPSCFFESLPLGLQPQLPQHMMQSTRQLLASYNHCRNAVYVNRQLSAEEEERARALATKYGSVLKSVLRI